VHSMTDDSSNVEQSVTAAGELFLLPGKLVLQTVVVYFPQLTDSLNSANAASLSAVMSLLVWLLAALVVGKLVGEIRNLNTRLVVALRGLVFRLRIQHNYMILRVFRFIADWFPGDRFEQPLSVGEMEFDDLDVAILRAAATCGPGFSISAPDVAEDLAVLPSKAQKSLEKLQQTKLVERTLGATDDFSNYKLTAAGADFMTRWRDR